MDKQQMSYLNHADMPTADERDYDAATGECYAKQL